MLLPGTISPKCSKAEGHLGEVLAQDSAGLGFRATIDVEAPRFSIIVAVYNRAAELQKCLEALQNVLEHEELIVVDDNSLENVRDVVAEYNARYFRTSRRAGPAAARNLGAIRAALAHWMYLFYSGSVFVIYSAAELLRTRFRSPATDLILEHLHRNAD
jgi:glycosyltransferase involved in cell wall biosynthesis